jgi:hypothetical protein
MASGSESIPDGEWNEEHCPRLQKHYGARMGGEDCEYCHGVSRVWVLRDRKTRSILGVWQGKGKPPGPA